MCLKENGFSVSLDVREQHLLSNGNQLSQWYDMRYNVVCSYNLFELVCLLLEANIDDFLLAYMLNIMHVECRMRPSFVYLCQRFIKACMHCQRAYCVHNMALA